MIWVLLCVLSLANGSKWEPGDPNRVVSSVSDAVRTGASMVLKFLNPDFLQIFSSVSNRLTEEMKTHQKGNNNGGNEFILLLLRLMGVDNHKVTNFAFDGVISLVHLMNRILIKNNEIRGKEKADFSLFRFILTHPQVSHLLTQMQDPKLVDLLLKESEEKLKNYPEENVDCIKVLICRSKPFVQEMQRSLKFFMNRENIKTSVKQTCEKRAQEETCLKGDESTSWEKADLEARMYFFVPSLKEVIEFGDKCNQLYPNCFY